MAKTTRPSLDHKAYWDRQLADTEIDRIFHCHWLYAGNIDDFADGINHISMNGVTITIRRDATGISASGLAGPVQTDFCGKLLFVKLILTSVTLRQQLDPYFDTLATISTVLCSADHQETYDIAANWKCLVENTLDDCHLATVHKNSLHRSSQDDWLGQYHCDLRGKNSAMRRGLNEQDRHFWERLERKLPLARHGSETDYRHYFLFPNLYIATFHGLMVVIHRVDSVTAEKSVLKLATYLPMSRALSRSEQALTRVVVKDQTDKARNVVTEDADVCALAQLGKHFAVHPGILGTSEARIGDFQTAVADLVNSDD